MPWIFDGAGLVDVCVHGRLLATLHEENLDWQSNYGQGRLVFSKLVTFITILSCRVSMLMITLLLMSD